MPLTAQTPLSTSGPTPGRTFIQEGGNREQKTQLANSLKNIGSGRGLSNRAYTVLLKAMEVHFTPEQEEQLAQIATNAGTDAGHW